MGSKNMPYICRFNNGSQKGEMSYALEEFTGNKRNKHSSRYALIKTWFITVIVASLTKNIVQQLLETIWIKNNVVSCIFQE